MFRSFITRRTINLISSIPSARGYAKRKKNDASNDYEPWIRSGHKYITPIPIENPDPVRFPFINRLALSILSTRPLPRDILRRLPFFPVEDKTMPKAAFYAVKSGFKPGIYSTWNECEDQVKGFKGAAYKKFPTEAQALEYLGIGSSKSTAPYSKNPAVPASTPGSKQPDLSPRRETSPATAAAESLAKEEGYNVSPEGFLVAYCDGSSLGNGKKGAKAGLGVFWGVDGESERKNLAEALPGVIQTNNRGELLAIIRAIEEHPHPYLPLEIRTDSQYSISCMTQYLPKWLNNGFKTATGEPVKNYDLLIHLLALMNRMGTNRIRMKHVKGHAGHFGNEQADRLANLGAAMPPLPDRTRWLTLKDANESAVQAWKESRPAIKPGTEKQPELQTTAIGDLSIEIEVDPDWMLTEDEMRELDRTQAF